MRFHSFPSIINEQIIINVRALFMNTNTKTSDLKLKHAMNDHAHLTNDAKCSKCSCSGYFNIHTPDDGICENVNGLN